MKNLFLAFVLLTLTPFLSKADCAFDPPNSVCIIYDAGTGKLTLKATYTAYASCAFTNFMAPPYTSWAYIKNPGGPGYFGEFEVSGHSTDLTTGDEHIFYEISIPGYSQQQCYDVYFITNRTWYYAGATGGWSFTPWPGLDPAAPPYNTWLAPNGYHYNIYSTQIPVSACSCPGTDTIPDCYSEFELKLNLNSIPWYSPPGGGFTYGTLNLGAISLIEPHPLSTYLYEWDGIAGPPSNQFSHTPGTHTVCVTEFPPGGGSCKTCMDFCIPEISRDAIPPSMMKAINTGNTPDQQQDHTESIELYPNPAKNKLDIRFSTSGKEPVSLSITDISGKAVRTIPKENYDQGKHSLQINTENMAPGIYQLNMNIGNHSSTHKISIVR